MQQTKIYCDHCGKELDVMSDYDNSEIEIPTKIFSADLCKNCTNELENVIGGFIKGSENNG